ncbi:hypothetical protein TNCV_1260631 [Trichonephila clavipes]|nr:hypothetical protein TNCV_1260631 [Trichonephila clavipes]
MKINVALSSCARAFGDGPLNFEPWSNDVDDTSAGTPPPLNYHTTPMGNDLGGQRLLSFLMTLLLCQKEAYPGIQSAGN